MDSRVHEDVLRAMVEALRHRGPDDDGFFSDGPYQAGMRRLSINDVEHGKQPLTNEAGNVVLFYNGEIYNYPELRTELEAEGHIFRTRSDGEVICHLYEKLGDALFEKLDGMFAAALWISNESRLILARDLAGEKPLYYAQSTDGGIAFASEIKSLRRFPGIDLSYNRQAIWDFPTFLWIPEPATAYTGIQALERGHLLIADGKGTRIRAYANRFNPGPLPTDEKGVVRETRRVVEEAVRSRLLSDVPIGAFLSGGLDSSIVATVASGYLPNLSTFTIGFEDIADPYHGRADEAVYAEALAKQLKTKHHCLRVNGNTFRSLLTEFCEFGDQPFAVSSGLGILAISRLARSLGIKVLLSGDGADECFGGYSWYEHLSEVAGFSSQVADVTRSPNHELPTFQNFGLDLKARKSALAGYDAPTRAWAWHYYAGEWEKQSLFAPGFGEGLNSSLRHFQSYNPSPDWEPIEYIRQDREFYFPQEMLRKLDRMTMAFSVEGRVPFAAPSVLAHADKLRLQDMVRGSELKYALRRAFADILPRDVLERPKHGFNVPIDHWLKTDWSDMLDETFGAGSRLHALGWLRGDQIAKARKMLDDPQRLNGHTLFCYIMLNRWLVSQSA